LVRISAGESVLAIAVTPARPRAVSAAVEAEHDLATMESCRSDVWIRLAKTGLENGFAWRGSDGARRGAAAGFGSRCLAFGLGLRGFFT
jgi:hypothetical protein